MIKTSRLKNVAIFLRTILSFVLSRKIIKLQYFWLLSWHLYLFNFVAIENEFSTTQKNLKHV